MRFEESKASLLTRHHWASELIAPVEASSWLAYRHVVTNMVGIQCSATASTSMALRNEEEKLANSSVIFRLPRFASLPRFEQNCWLLSRPACVRENNLAISDGSCEKEAASPDG